MQDGGLIYLYDGSFEGLLSAVHTAYYSREDPEQIVEADSCQQSLFCRVREVETDRAKYEAVYRSIPQKISPNALFNVRRVYLSDDASRGTLVFNYLKLGFHMGARVDMDLQNRWVARVHRTAQRVSSEACRMREFVRFSQMENGVLFSKIEPDNNVLEMICPYFADRLSALPWVIADARRGLAAVYDTKRWEILPYDTANIVAYSPEEEAYQKLWKRFYNIIGIESRKNERQRRQCMPKKYWKNMTEFRI